MVAKCMTAPKLLLLHAFFVLITGLESDHGTDFCTITVIDLWGIAVF